MDYNSPCRSSAAKYSQP